MAEYQEYGQGILRILLGLLFLIPGIDKLVGLLGDGHMIAQMLGTSGAWILLIVEILFGIAVIIGWKLKFTPWPLAIVMLGAIFMAVIPGRAENPMWVINLLFHLVALAGLASVALGNKGAWTVDGA